MIDLLHRKQAADRRSRRGTFLVGIAAGISLVAGGLVLGAQIGAQNTPPAAHTQLGPAEQFYAMGTPVPGTGRDGVTGGLVLESKGWGTHAALKLSGGEGAAGVRAGGRRQERRPPGHDGLVGAARPVTAPRPTRSRSTCTARPR
ncbi:hypothetical protein ACFSTC_15830 [Nonomuraea ferruginea]